MPRSVSGDIRLWTTEACILRKAPDIKSGEICLSLGTTPAKFVLATS